jgi:competence ComEA-like helix-hairpin-helix protein
MHDAESSSLRRAAILLLAVSAFRWGLGHLGERDALRSADVLVEHAAATGEAAAQGDRRREPLAPGERIDPNRAEEADLDRLPGIGPATAAAIVGARDTGQVFRRPEDLLVVRGIGPALVGRIGETLDLSSPPPRRVPRALPPSPRPGGTTASLLPIVAAPLDLNRASVDELQGLPGIGPALAGRIVAERQVRPFGSVEELERVSGIGAATVARLRPLVTVGATR